MIRKIWYLVITTLMDCLMLVVSFCFYFTFKVQMKCFFLFPNLKEQQKSGRLPFTVS